jgi:hypothetical protein
VLIPLGRSLQRTAAAPAFFEFPRVVAAIDVEPASPGAPLPKDRNYVGYQERSDLIEVISYNETAGRFEFQVVRDYREGGAREVVYARRAMCAACHQNLAPLFSRQVWEETTRPAYRRAPRQYRRDGSRERTDYRRRSTASAGLPNAIDAATDRANLLGVWQLLADGLRGRRRGCAVPRHRAARRSGRLTTARVRRRSPRGDELLRVRPYLERALAGIAIPHPDISNRDALPPGGARPSPLPRPRPGGVRARSLRAPLEVWIELDRRPRAALWPDSRRSSPRPKRGWLDRSLRRALAANVVEQRREAPCEITWTGSSARFKCVGAGAAPLRVAGRVDLRGTRIAGGEVGALQVDGAPTLEHLEVGAGTFDANAGRAALAVGTRGARARLADSGGAGIALAWKPDAPPGARRVSTRECRMIDDFAPVRAAIARGASTGAARHRPFNPRAVPAALRARCPTSRVVHAGRRASAGRWSARAAVPVDSRG